MMSRWAVALVALVVCGCDEGKGGGVEVTLGGSPGGSEGAGGDRGLGGEPGGGGAAGAGGEVAQGGGAPILDVGPMAGDPADAAVASDGPPPPPRDAFLGTTIANCTDACDRYDECERTDEIFGDRATCVRQCERLALTEAAGPWWECLSVEACGLMHLCRVPEIPPPTCAAVCAAAAGCEIALPVDCLAACEAGGVELRTCGERLVAGECAAAPRFVECALQIVAPDCLESCRRPLECGLSDAATCVGACLALPGDPLAVVRAARRVACMNGAGPDCQRVAACDSGAVEIYPGAQALCAALADCELGQGLSCEGLAVSLWWRGGLDAMACAVAGYQSGCPAEPLAPAAACLDAVPGGARRVCGAVCGDLEACGIEGGGQPCVTRCRQQAQTPGDAQEVEWDLLRCAGAESCEALGDCVASAGPVAQCAATCATLDACGAASATCQVDCVAGWARDREASWRACVAAAGEDCEAVAACPRLVAPPCVQVCEHIAACGGGGPDCAAGCDDGWAANPEAMNQSLACYFSAAGCAGDAEGHGQQDCQRDAQPGRACLDFCRARSERCDPAGGRVEDCLPSCDPTAGTADALRFRIARGCLERLAPGGDCEAVSGCLPGEDPVDCVGFCAGLAACEGQDGPAGCVAACEGERLARRRIIDARICLGGRALACEPLRDCLDVSRAGSVGPGPVALDEAAFCGRWSGCGLDQDFDFPVPCQDVLDGFRPEELRCMDVALQRRCPGFVFELFDQCRGGGPPPPSPHPAEPACQALCHARSVCDEALNAGDCVAGCLAEIPRDDADALANAQPRLDCATAWTCEALDTCLRDASPAGVCDHHCAVVDGCGLAPEGCAADCVAQFPRQRQRAWRECVRAAEGCEAVAACAPVAPPPCAGMCQRLRACGLAAPDCEIACDDDSVEDRLGVLTRVACVAAAPACEAAQGTFGVRDCLADPEVGGAACTTYCRAVTECDLDNPQTVAECFERCAVGFGDAEALRYAAASPCLEGVRPGATCPPLAACVPPAGEPDCAGHCARLAGCGLADAACLDECAAAPDLDVQGCVLASLSRGDGCRDVAACVGFEGEAPSAACDALCGVESGCDAGADRFVCERSCTPAPEGLGVQLACAQVAGCGGLEACRALGPEVPEICEGLCGAACGAFGEECLSECAGRVGSPNVPPTYSAEVQTCLDGMAEGCGADEGEACFAPARCDLGEIAGRVGPEGGVFDLNTGGGRDNYQATCAGGAGGPEAILVLTLPARRRVDIHITAADFDTALYVRSACDEAGSEVACDDDGGGGLRSRLTLELDAGTYFIFVDGFGVDGPGGPATVSVGTACVADRECDAAQRCELAPVGGGRACGCPDGDANCFDCFVGEEICAAGQCVQQCAGPQDCFDGDCVAGACVGAGRCVPR